MTWAMSPAREVDDRYLLRDLVWSDLCDVAMKPAFLSTRIRFYGCTNPRCPRPLIEADLVEVLAWQAFQHLFTEPEAEITDQEQHQALHHTLKWVSIGADLGDLRYYGSRQLLVDQGVLPVESGALVEPA